MPSPSSAAAAPLDLPRLVMRRSAWVAAAVLGLALLLGLARMADDMADEVDAAMALADTVAQLSHLPSHDDAQALALLRRVQSAHRLRHLVLQVADEGGQVLLAPQPEPRAAWPLDQALRLHRRLAGRLDERRVAWTVPREGGRLWVVSLTASHESERREALVSLAGMLGLLLLAVAALLLAMRANLHHAFRPLGRLLAAINAIEGHDTRAVRALPTMPIRELETLAAALRHLAEALDDEQARRRRLSQQVLTLQEDERMRLARDLHDEFGQRLTALRADAAWLLRQLDGDAALQPVVAGIAAHGQAIQRDVRALLSQLQPFGASDAGQPEPMPRLLALMQGLVAAWQAPGREARAQLRLVWRWRADDRQPWAEAAQALAPLAGLALPRPLALALYRISQEALTNVMRHAEAGQAELCLGFTGAALAGAPLQIDWQVSDDGRGLPDAQLGDAAARGNGIAGLRERVWAQGGDLQLGPASPGAARPGLRLATTLQAHWQAVNDAAP